MHQFLAWLTVPAPSLHRQLRMSVVAGAVACLTQGCADSQPQTTPGECKLGPAKPLVMPAEFPLEISACSDTCTAPKCTIDRRVEPQALWFEPSGTLAVVSALSVKMVLGDYEQPHPANTLTLLGAGGGVGWLKPLCAYGYGAGQGFTWSRPWGSLRIVGMGSDRAAVQAYNAKGQPVWSVSDLSFATVPLDRPGHPGLYVLGYDAYTAVHWNTTELPIGLWQIDSAGKVLVEARVPGKDREPLGHTADANSIRLLTSRNAGPAGKPYAIEWLQLDWTGQVVAQKTIDTAPGEELIGVAQVTGQALDGWLLSVHHAPAQSPKSAATSLVRLDWNGNVLWSVPWPDSGMAVGLRAQSRPSGGTRILFNRGNPAYASDMALVEFDGKGAQLGPVVGLEAPGTNSSRWSAYLAELASNHLVIAGFDGALSDPRLPAASVGTVVAVYDYQGHVLGRQILGVAGTDFPTALAIHGKRLVILRNTTDDWDGVCGKSPGGQPCNDAFEMELNCP